MSSYTTPESANPELQIAPVGEKGPDFDEIKEAFQKCVSDQQPYVDQCRQNYSTRYAIWSGQSPDGKKHAREGSKIDPTPWDGASDLRVYLVDNLINKRVAMKCMAVDNANLFAEPVEGNDWKRSKAVSNFMRWLVTTQIPDVDREIELLANYYEEKGAGLMGVFWETIQERSLQVISVDEFQAQYPDVDFTEVLESGQIDSPVTAILEEWLGVSNKKALKMLKEMKETGKTTAPVIGKRRSRPVLRAFNLDVDCFISQSATDIEGAPAIYRIQYYTPEALRSKVNTEGWNPVWVEKAISTCRGKILQVTPYNYLQPLSRSFIYIQQRLNDLIGVVYAYQRLSDEDGVPGIYLTVFNPELPPSNDTDGKQPGYAFHSLYGDSSGEYPFVLFRREYLSRKLHDSRGIAEPLQPLQNQIKVHKDSRIDTASYNIMPPIFYPIGRPPMKWGASARIPERRPNEYHYGQPIPYDPNTDTSEDKLTKDAMNYVGFGDPNAEESANPIELQRDINKFLKCLGKVYSKVWSLYKKFGDEQVAFRVMGLQEADPEIFQKGEQDEEYNYRITWDVQSTDSEQMKQKLEALIKYAQVTDREGTVDWTEVNQLVLEMIDPNWAQRVLRPVSVGVDKVVNDTQDDLAKISAGMSKNAKINTPPNIALSTIQNFFAAPDVQARYMQDEAFRERLDAYVKQLEFQLQQQQNAQIGRQGAITPTPALGS